MAPDADLLIRIARGESQAFDELYTRYCNRIYRYVLSVSGLVSIAEEATQDAFLYVLEKPDKFDQTRCSSALNWILGIARNRVRSLLRAHSRTVPIHGHEPCVESLERTLELSRLGKSLVLAIGELNLDQREVLVLCCIHQLDYASVAEILGLPIGTVRSRLSRSRRALLVKLANREKVSPEEVLHGIQS